MNHNNIETERKFLVRSDAFLALAVKAYQIKQGYIAHDGGNTVRVRIRDKQGFLTIKGPSLDGMSRFEWEREIPLQDAEALTVLCHGFIDKTRYLVPAGDMPSETCRRPCLHEWEGPAVSREGGQACLSAGTTDSGRDEAKRRVSEGMSPAGTERFFEVDVFHGANEGLVMAEIELAAPDEPFARPAWLGREVTGDRRYYNAYLIGNPYSIWK